MSLWGRFVTAVQAFKEAFLSSDPIPGKEAENFSDFGARKLRYQLLWAYFENTAYRDIHRWATKYRADLGLYKYTRGIYNPSYRLGEFWATHLMGGMLDPDAGDGKAIDSVLPIVTKQAALRPAIARLWRDSNLQINKPILGRWGTVLGDVAIQPVDDVQRGKVYLKVIHPGIIKSVDMDPFGNVKAYTFEEERREPGSAKLYCTYTEDVTRDGDNVVFRTFKNGSAYDWTGNGEEWTEPYGFVPLVVIQHLNVGIDWGWSELHAGLGKFREVDDLASKLSDQIRKTVEAPWLFAGVSKPTSTPNVAHTTPTATSAEPGREEIPALYTNNADAKAHSLVADLDLVGTLAHIDKILKEIERDYPELGAEQVATAAGDASGRALRIARQPISDKVGERRPSYDNALMRAQQMAIAMGGYRGYEGYEGFNLDSYAAGTLDHTIADRPVFKADPLDEIEIEHAFWTAAEVARRTGIPIEIYLKRHNWSDQDIAEIVKVKEEHEAKALQQQQRTAINNADAERINGGE